MEMRNCSEITIKKESREYVLHLPLGANNAELYLVALEILNAASAELSRIAAQATAQAPKDISGDQAQNAS